MMLFSTSHQQAMSGHFLVSRASVRVVVAPEDKNDPFCLPLLSFYIWADVIWYGICLVSLGQLSWLCPFPRSCPAPACHWWGGAKILERQPWCCASTGQQQPKHWCVINTFLATSTEHSTIRAAMGRINSISARPNTKLFPRKLSLPLSARYGPIPSLSCRKPHLELPLRKNICVGQRTK